MDRPVGKGVCLPVGVLGSTRLIRTPDPVMPASDDVGTVSCRIVAWGGWWYRVNQWLRDFGCEGLELGIGWPTIRSRCAAAVSGWLRKYRCQAESDGQQRREEKHYCPVCLRCNLSVILILSILLLVGLQGASARGCGVMDMYSTIRLGRTQQIAWQRMFRPHLAESNPRSRMNPIHPTQLRPYRLPPNPRPAYPLSTTSLITSTGGFRVFYLVVLYFERYVVISLTFIPPPSHPAAPVLGQLLVGHIPHCRMEVNAKTTRSRT